MLKSNISLNILCCFFLSMSGLFSQDVSVSLGSVEVDGYTSDIIVPLSISSPNNSVGGIQFDLSIAPNLLELFSTTPTENAPGFSSDFSILSDGMNRVVFYNSSSSNGIPSGTNVVVLNLHFDGSELLSAVLELFLSNLIVSDENGNILTTNSQNGSISIGNVVHISASSDTGDVDELVTLFISLGNTGNVGGVQCDIYDTPNYVDIVEVTTIGRAETFSADYSELDNGNTRIVLFDPNNGVIAGLESGLSEPIVQIDMLIHSDAYAGNAGINFDNVLITDSIGGFYWVASSDSGTVAVYPGYIEEPHNLSAQNGMDAQVLLVWDPPYGPIPPDFTEDFETGELPADWEVISNGNGWYITEDGSSNFWTIPSHSQYIVSNDDGFNGEDTPENDGNDYLVLPGLNFFGATSITLNYASFFTGAYGSTASVEVSTDDGNSFVVLQSVVEIAEEWIMQSVDLSEFSDLANVKIAFHHNDNASWASGWAVDDILISFSDSRVTTNLHFELTEIGHWAITSEKEDIINSYPGGIPYELKVDLNNPLYTNDRPVEIDEYKIFRSENIDGPFENIDAVDGDVTSYLDENVVNSSTYYYYITAVYPSGSESGATNIIQATPVEWVECSISNGASLTGQMDTLDLYIQNESHLGLFYFEIMDYPDVLNSLAVLPTVRTENWSLEIVDLGNGNIGITGISLGLPLESGDGAVCRAVLYPVADEEVTVNLSFADASIQDENFVELNWSAESATYEVGIETQYLMLSGGYGLPGGMCHSSVFLENSQPIYGLQVDILSNPPFVTGVYHEFGENLNLANWELTGEMVGNIYRLIAYDNTLSNPIMPGIRHLAEITYGVLDGVPEGSVIDLTVNESVLSDANGLPMHTEGSPHSFYIGEPAVVYEIKNASGDLIPGGTGTFEIHMTNTDTVSFVDLVITDMPNYATITSVTGIERFSSAIIDPLTGEALDGTGKILAFDLTPGALPGEGAILEVNVEFSQNIQNSSVIMMFTGSAGDQDLSLIAPVISEGFGEFSGFTMDLTDDFSIPEKFSLYSNYPNPFNPVTTIPYDLESQTLVKLQIFDLKGRLIKTLVNKSQSAGRYISKWDATDMFGGAVSAGVYLYHIEAGENSLSKKMILLK